MTEVPLTPSVASSRFMASLAVACISLSPSEAAHDTTATAAAVPRSSDADPGSSAVSHGGAALVESPAALLHSCLSRPTCACAVLGAFAEKDSTIIAAVWDMVLMYLKVSRPVIIKVMCKPCACVH